MQATAVTGNRPRFLASLSGPQLVTEGGDWTGVPAWGVWRESEAGKLWAPSPTPAFWDLAWPSLHIWQQKLEPQACHLHKTTAPSPKHFPICLLPALRRRWGRVINPDLQMEKCSSNLGFGSKILGAGAGVGLKVGTKGTLSRKRSSLEEGTDSFPQSWSREQALVCSPPS